MSDFRMPDLNQAMVAGRLTRDPDFRYTKNNTAYADFDLAVSRRYRSGEETKEETSFFAVQCWARTAEWVRDNLTKGRPVLVSGRLKQDTWEDRETGQKRSKVLIVADAVQSLDWAAQTDKPADPPPVNSAAKPRWNPPKPPAATPDAEDDLPF